MISIIGVRFRNAGKIYYFDPGDKKFNRGSSVIVETARGLEMGLVIVPNKEVEDDTVVQPLKPVLRMATEEDFNVIKENKLKQKEAYFICKEKIRKHNLDMKLVDVEYTFDNNKILFYFTADGRIDFRELVKDLASIFKTRIELRQIGVRDETKLLGGVGICGRGLCCATYLSDFVPVSIRMAKEQNLSLNPTKISGVCGRLMCCLKNEEDTYEYLNSRLPSIGDIVQIKDENLKGEVQSVNVLRQKVKVLIRKDGDETEMREILVDDLKVCGKRRHNHHGDDPANAPEMKEIAETEERKMTSEEEDSGEQNERRGRKERQNRSENGEREGRQNRGENGEREGRQNRGENGEREDRQNRGRRERQNRNENGEREGRQNRNENGEREYRQNRGRRERQNRNENGEREGRQNRNENGEREGRQNRNENGEREGRQNRNENGEGRENRSRRDRGNRQNRGNRGENNERSSNHSESKDRPVRQDEETAKDEQHRSRRGDRRRRNRKEGEGRDE